MSFKFIAYADIHYDRLAAQCVTFDDCAEVEKQVHQRVFEGDFDFSVFIGDRFLKRNPEDEIKTKADQVLLSVLGSDNRRAPHYSLIGNHDWVTNSMRWHTSESLKWLSRFTGKLTIMDEAGTYPVLKTDMGMSPDVCLHVLPAGAKFDFSKYKVDCSKFNLFLFHDMLKGSFMDDLGEMQFESGISMEEIDRAEFDMVLAGDIHVPQQFPLKNTRGGYVGSVLQRTRADADKARGWLEVYVDGSPGAWEIHTEFVPTKPLFSCLSFEVGPNTRYEEIKFDENFVIDKRVEVKLTGKKIDVDRVADDPRWKNYVELLGVRKLELARDYEVESKDAVVDLSTSQNIGHDLELYLGSGFGSLGTLSRERMFEVLKVVENEQKVY